jgi:hypothetical protein
LGSPSSRSGNQGEEDQPHVTVSSRGRRHNTAQRATAAPSSSRNRAHSSSESAGEKHSCSWQSSRFQQRPLRNPTASLTASCHSVDTPRNDRRQVTRPKYSAVFCTRSAGMNGLMAQLALLGFLCRSINAHRSTFPGHLSQWSTSRLSVQSRSGSQRDQRRVRLREYLPQDHQHAEHRPDVLHNDAHGRTSAQIPSPCQRPGMRGTLLQHRCVLRL